DEVREYFKDEPIIFETQPIGDDHPYGTGFAVMQGMDYIDDNSTVVILYGDTPLITGETINKLMNYHKNKKHQATVLTAILDDPTGYGRIIRQSDGNILKIIEQKDASPEELKVKEVNSGIYCFQGRLLKESLGKINNNNSQNEY